MGVINLTGDCGLAGAVHERGEFFTMAQRAMVEAYNKDIGYLWPEGREMTEAEKAEHAASKAAERGMQAPDPTGKPAAPAASNGAAPTRAARGAPIGMDRPRRPGNLGVSVNATPNPPAAAPGGGQAPGNEYTGRRLG